MEKHRIYTDVGQDHRINVEIKEDFNIMEILSLKFSQKDVFSSGNCSEYGVVVGRISANNGLGIPNTKISIFIPLSDLDVNDPVISALYPYTSTSDKDVNGYRYNLLPQREQHAGHVPTGTFFDQEDILTRQECLQVFESYYTFTVKTNNAGDFMIWGFQLEAKHYMLILIYLILVAFHLGHMILLKWDIQLMILRKDMRLNQVAILIVYLRLYHLTKQLKFILFGVMKSDVKWELLDLILT